MHREYVRWFSPSLGRDMEMLVFGHAGTPMLAFPSSRGRFYEWEDFRMVDALHHQLEHGHNQLYCVDSIDGESFYNRSVDPYTRIKRHQQYNRYISDEVLPFLNDHSGHFFVIAAGASFGAYHALNYALKMPWRFGKLIAMSGAFEIRSFMDGFYDENVYFDNPVDYLPNMHDHNVLEQLRRNDLRLLAGDHDICLEPNRHFSRLLNEKSIPHRLEVWGDGRVHDWPLWREMIAAHVA